MIVTIAIRWSVQDPESATREARRAKAVWLKSGAQEFRVGQFYTGPHTGDWVFHMTFADMAAYAKATALARASDEMKDILAASARAGNEMQEREILVGLDI
jgi:hypothetical protein